MNLELLFTIVSGIVLGQFIYQYLIDDVIQGFLKKRIYKKTIEVFQRMAADNQKMGLYDAIQSNPIKKDELH